MKYNNSNISLVYVQEKTRALNNYKCAIGSSQFLGKIMRAHVTYGKSPIERKTTPRENVYACVGINYEYLLMRLRKVQNGGNGTDFLVLFF